MLTGVYHLSRRTAQRAAKELLGVEISLDGMTEYHNKLRKNKQSFKNAMKTYRVLEKMQIHDSRLRIHAITTVTADNLDEVRRLTKYLYDSCPLMDHHNIAIIRGDRKNLSLREPDLDAYRALYTYVNKLWLSREKGRFGSIVEPLLQWAKCKTIEAQDQVIPCMAGRLSAVVYANGDVSMCEFLPPLGNIRTERFHDLWCSSEAHKVRQSIKRKECYCTNEIFLWPSITFQPLQLLKVFAYTKICRKI
jgi:sulfatase maturation enzyme AslB (radical SAM superfamily)